MRPLLGTFVEIATEGDSSRDCAAVAAAFAAIERVQRLMSFHDPRSDVSRINAARRGEQIRIDEETYAVLLAARAIGDLSNGAFDIAMAPALVHRGFLPAPADGGEIPPLSPPTNYRELELLPASSTRWRRKGWIDLGGIAKGYAVDRAVDTLVSQGVQSGLVNAGGDLRCFGKSQPLYLRAPDDPSSLRLVGCLRESAAATSAGYFRMRAGSRPAAGQLASARSLDVDALVDPPRGECIPWRGSITVLAQDCRSADALTKVVRVAPHLAPRVLAHFNAQAVILDSQGMRTWGRRRLESAPAASFDATAGLAAKPTRATP